MIMDEKLTWSKVAKLAGHGNFVLANFLLISTAVDFPELKIQRVTLRTNSPWRCGDRRWHARSIAVAYG